MLARGAGPRPSMPLEPPKEGPSAAELLIPDDVMKEASASQLVALVQQSQEKRIQVAATFDDQFEHLVTAGRADDYAALCERFMERFRAIADNLDRAGSALAAGSVHGDALAQMVRAINAEEARRLELQLELQVTRQRLSLSEAESEEAQGGKQRVKTLEGALSTSTGKIYEALEELRCEAADLED